jgi:hypothetical protein
MGATTQWVDAGSIRTIWAVQDKLALNADEEKALELKRKIRAAISGSCGMPISRCQVAHFPHSQNDGALLSIG